MRAHYTALRRLDLGGDRCIMPGESVPDEVRNKETLLSAGHIQRVYLPYEDVDTPGPPTPQPLPPVAEDEPLVTDEADEESEQEE